MSRLSGRVRAGIFAGVVAATATLGVVVPGGGASAAARPQIRHATLTSVLSRLPNYFPGVVHWKVSTSWRHYGTTNWDTNTITISAFTPLNLLYSVVAHEWSHEIQAFDYHRDFWGIVRSLNRHFGGAGSSGQRGVEYAADCMAIELGATWTDYTSYHNKKWRHSAKRLLAGHPLRAYHHHHKSAPSASRPVAVPTSSKPTSSKPTNAKPTTPERAPAAPQPEPYPAPPQYTITWTG
jgi:cell division septation protein DedD